MDLQTKVERWINDHADEMMTTEKFWSTLVDKYDALKQHLMGAGVSEEDAADALQDLAVWGGSNDWDAWNLAQVTNAFDREVPRRPDTRFAYRGMKLTMGWLWRNKSERNGTYSNEIPVGEGASTDLDPQELTGELSFESAMEALLTDPTDGEVAGEDFPHYDSEVPTATYLAILTGKQRQVLVMRNDGLNQWEIAERIGIDQSNVARRLMTAFESLKATFPRIVREARSFDLKDTFEYPAGRPGCNLAGFPVDRHEVVVIDTNTGAVNNFIIGLWPAFEVGATMCDRKPWEEINQEKGSGADYAAWWRKRNTITVPERRAYLPSWLPYKPVVVDARETQIGHAFYARMRPTDAELWNGLDLFGLAQMAEMQAEYYGTEVTENE